MSFFIEEDIITGNAFKSVCEDFIDESKPYIDLSKKPKIIFCYTDWVEKFISAILPHIDYKFKLITHNADRPVSNNFINLLNDERLLQWYGMNCHIQHDKLTPIPIGIANEKWPHGDKKVLLETSISNIKKTNFVYSNFQIHTNYTKRQKVHDLVNKMSYITKEQKNLDFKNYLNVLSTYKFVISPPGNSVDCHRIWESIYLGVIPIVEKHLALKTFKDLPIMWVNSFEELTSEMLEDSYDTLKIKNNLKSKFSFYKNLIQQ